MKRPYFLYHEPDFGPKRRPRYAHPYNWPFLIGVLISSAIVGGAIWLAFKIGGLQ